MTRRVFGNVPGLKPMTMAPVFGEPVYEIVIQTDKQGLMKTRITQYPVENPPTQLQILGMLLDCMQGQFQSMVQTASMIIDPTNGQNDRYGQSDRKGQEPNGGQEKEDHHDSGGNSSRGNGGG